MVASIVCKQDNNGKGLDIDWKPPSFTGLANSNNIIHALEQDKRGREENGEDEETCSSSSSSSIRDPNASQYRSYTPSAARESQRAALTAGGEETTQQRVMTSLPPPKPNWQVPSAVDQAPTSDPGRAPLSTPSQVQAAQPSAQAIGVSNRVWQRPLPTGVSNGAGGINLAAKAEGVMGKSVPGPWHPVRALERAGALSAYKQICDNSRVISHFVDHNQKHGVYACVCQFVS